MSRNADPMAPSSGRSEKNAAEANPWTTLRTERLYEDGWIALDGNEVRDASGNLAPYSVVRFKKRGRCVLPLDGEGCTYLVGQYRYAARYYSWELPAGGGAADEEPLDAARRELQEETGLAAEHWLPLLGLTVSGSITTERARCFVAWGLERGERHLDPQEVVRVRRVPFAQALRMALDGEIDAAVSVAAILSAYTRASLGELPDDLLRLLRRDLPPNAR